MRKSAPIATFVTLLVVAVTLASAYVQHFITTIHAEQWVLLVVGAVMPPLGVLHGMLVWMGVF